MNYKTYAWFGIISFILSLLTFIPLETISRIIYSLSFVASAIFVWGFIDISNKTKNTPLNVGSWAILVISILGALFYLLSSFGLEIVSLDALQDTTQLMSLGIEILAILAIVFISLGAFLIVQGVGLLRLKNKFNGLATAAGILGIITGVSFITILLSFIGLFTMLALDILLIIILFKADEAI